MKTTPSFTSVKGLAALAVLLFSATMPLHASKKTNSAETYQDNLLAVVWYWQADKALDAYLQLQARGDEAAIATLKAIIREYSIKDAQLASAKAQY